MHFNTKLIGWVVIIIVVVGALYSLFTKSDIAGTTAAETAQTQSVGADLLTLLGKLQTVNFNTDLFGDQNFNGLTDFAIPLPLPNLGRPNPFDKIGTDIGVVTTAPQTPATSGQTTPAR